jgi:hypothetical protein
MVLFQYLQLCGRGRVLRIGKPDVAQVVDIVVDIAVGCGPVYFRSPYIVFESREELQIPVLNGTCPNSYRKQYLVFILNTVFQ